jgi:hypothetical protein
VLGDLNVLRPSIQGQFECSGCVDGGNLCCHGALQRSDSPKHRRKRAVRRIRGCPELWGHAAQSVPCRPTPGQLRTLLNIPSACNTDKIFGCAN